MVAARTVVVVRRSDAAFAEEAVEALGIRRVIIAELQSVIAAVVARAVELAAVHARPDARFVFFVLEEPQLAHTLAQRLDIHAVRAVGVIGCTKQRLCILVDRLFKLRQIPLRRIGILDAHHIVHITAIFNRRRHIPEAALIKRQAAECRLAARIRDKQLVLRARDFMARQEALVVDLNQTRRANRSIVNVYLIRMQIARRLELIQIGFHAENTAIAAVRAHIEPLELRIVGHIDNTAVFMRERRQLARARHIPAGAVGHRQLRIAGCCSRISSFGCGHKVMGNRRSILEAFNCGLAAPVSIGSVEVKPYRAACSRAQITQDMRAARIEIHLNGPARSRLQVAHHIGVSCVELELDKAMVRRFQIAKNDLAAIAHSGDRAARAGAADGILILSHLDGGTAGKVRFAAL